MFTGIVTDIGEVTAVTERDGVCRLAIKSAYGPDSLAIGSSVACAGICLTVVSCGPDASGALFEVDLAPETLRVTGAGDWRVGSRINLERSLRVGDELGGHLVSGHVDGLAKVVTREAFGEAICFTFEIPPDLARFVAPKGSVALDGTSLTVNSVDANRFDCMLIPHTLQATTWGERETGDRVHVEVDQIARYVARLTEAG